MANIRDAVDEQLVTMIVMSQQLSGRELAEAEDALPPKHVRNAILTDTDTDDAGFWYNEQRDWQRRQRRVLEALEPPTREMALAGELPIWMAEEWAKFITFEWSHRLGWAVERAEEWLAKTSG
jgi:hypothetical protein